MAYITVLLLFCCISSDSSLLPSVNDDLLSYMALDYGSSLDQFEKFEAGVTDAYKTQPIPTGFLDARAKKLPAFMKWAKTNIELDGIELKEVPEVGFGVFATRDLPANTTVIQMPTTMMLSTDQRLASFKTCINTKRLKVNRKDVKFPETWDSNVLVALRVIAERLNDSSKFHPYVSFFPTTFVHPVYFTQHECTYLRGSNAFTQTIWTQYEIVQQYLVLRDQIRRNEEGCKPLGLLKENFSFALYKWGFLISLTRSYDEFGDGNIKLIPIWDTLNHASIGAQINYQLTYKDDPSGGSFRTWLTKPVEKGNQIFLKYKELYLPMDGFFTLFGVIIPEAPVVIPCKVLPIDPDYAKKKTVLKILGFNKENSVRVSPHNQPIPIDLKDFPYLLAVATGLIDRDCLTQNNWEKIWTYLADQIEFQLTTYPYLLQENIKMREDNKYNVSTNALLAMDFVIAEQTSLAMSAEYAKRLATQPMFIVGRAEDQRPRKDEL